MPWFLAESSEIGITLFALFANIQANALRQYREDFGAVGYEEAGLTTADVTSALQLVEKNKFHASPTIEFLRDNARDYYTNLQGDTTKANKSKTNTRDMKQNPFGDNNLMYVF